MLAMTIPAATDMMLTVRMALSGLCASRGMDIGAVESARIASDEAMWCLLNQPGKPERLNIACDWADGRVNISFEAQRGGGMSACETHNPAIARSILETLADCVRLSADDRGVYAIHMSLPRQSAEAGGV